MLFAHLKRILGLGRLRLRGPCGANDEFLLAATAQNLRKIGGHHMWCEDRLSTSKLGKIFVPNAFFEALIAHGLGGLAPTCQFHEF